MDGLVSVIVPVYNAEMYLERCIKSIVEQTYNRIELILIDDGSTDRTGDICDDWAVNNDKVIVIHKQNGGVSHARNIGIKRAHGDYIVFVDSDDYLEHGMIEMLVDCKERYDVNVCICGFYYKYRNKKQLVVEKEGLYSLKQLITVMEKWKLNPLIGSPWNKLFDARVLKEKNILYRLNTKYAEDYMFNLEFFSQIDSIYMIEEGLYYYDVETPGSLTKTNYLDIEKWTNVQFEVYECVRKFEKKINGTEYTKLSNEVLCYMLTLNLYERALAQEESEFVNFCSDIISEKLIYRILKEKKHIQSMPYMSVKYKIIRSMLMSNNAHRLYGVLRTIEKVSDKFA